MYAFIIDLVSHLLTGNATQCEPRRLKVRKKTAKISCPKLDPPKKYCPSFENVLKLFTLPRRRRGQEVRLTVIIYLFIHGRNPYII